MKPSVNRAGRDLFSKRKPVQTSPSAKRAKFFKASSGAPGPLDKSSAYKKRKSVFEFDNGAAQRDVEFENERALEELAFQPLSADELTARELALAEIQRSVLTAECLPLRDCLDGDNHLVFARGPANANLMIIGEAPGAEEARTGSPFVGPSGQLLAQQLAKHGLQLDRHAYITNTVYIRPPSNRDPTWEELVAYAQYLRQQIAIVQPKVILCLGRIAGSLISNGFGSLNALKGEQRTNSSEHAVRGLNLESLYKNASNSGALTLREHRFVARYYLAYHPAALLRQASKAPVPAAGGAAAAATTFNSNKLTERWDADFVKLRQMLDQPRVEFIDAESIVAETAPPDFPFAQPALQSFYTDPNALPAELATHYAENGLEFELHRADYNEYKNTFSVFGRTADDRALCVEVQRPQFCLYVGHPSVAGGTFDEPATLAQLRADVGAELRKEAAKRTKYQRRADWNSVDIQLEVVQARNYINYRPTTKRYLRVAYYEQDLKYVLRGLLSTAFQSYSEKPIKFFESNLSSSDQFFLSKNIYVRGWVRIEPGSSLLYREPANRISTCALEYSVNYADLTGFSPNPGEAGNAKWEKQAPTRVLALDAEMLNTGGMFPTPEQDPIVSICAVANTWDKHNRPNLTERIRVSARGKDREVRSTGRSNYDGAVVFCVGSLERIEESVFKRTHLPNIPLPPSEFDVTWTTGGRIAAPAGPLQYTKAYGISIRKWNEFIERFQLWHRLVGRRRAQLVLRKRTLYEALARLTSRPGGKDPKKEWKEEARIVQWETDVLLVLQFFKACAQKKDIASVSEPADWLQGHVGLPQVEAEQEFGEIQARWTLFRPAGQVFSFASEADMLRGFYRYIREYDPDMITGYNSNNFDLSYFIRRVKVLDIRDPEMGHLISMGRLRGQEDKDIVKTSFSRAMGDRSYHTIQIPGRDCYDLMNYMMRDVKLQSYSLASVAQHFLKDSKNDVPYSAIPSLFRNNRHRLNAYCLKDAELVVMLMNDTNNMNYLISLARLIGQMHIERLYVDGKQAQVFSVLMRFLRGEGLSKIMPDRNMYSKEDGDAAESFMGAHVFDPKTKGLYLLLLLCLDYNSLYPSLMLAYNLGHDVGGTAARMLKYNVPLEQCHRTSRQFVNPKTKLPEYYYFRQPQKRTRAQAEAEGLRSEECNITPTKKAFHSFTTKATEHELEVRRLLNQQLETLSADAEVDPAAAQPVADDNIADLPEAMIELQRVEPPPGEILTYVFDRPEDGSRFQLKPGELEAAGRTEEEAVGCVVQLAEMWTPTAEDAAICGAVKRLLSARKRVKTLMEPLHPSSDEYRRLDMIQLALKIICNSTYGATGVKSGKLAGMHISDTVTAMGRKTILTLAAELTVEYDADVQGGDTDSVFVHFPHITKLEQIYEVVTVTDRNTGEQRQMTRIQEILNFANALVPPPMKIDFEKAFTMMFAIAKKRAATRTQMPIWDGIEQQMVFQGDGKLDFKGLETKRRDSCLIAQETFSGFLGRVLKPGSISAEANIEEAVKYVRSKTEQVMAKNVPYHEMIQARQLSKKNYNTKVPHVELCKKFRRRGLPVPELGSRIPFIVVTGPKDRKFADSVEDPDYALQHNLLPDYKYILDKKIRAPIERFTACMPKGTDYNRRMFGGFNKIHRENILEDDPIARHLKRATPCIQCGKPAERPICSACSVNSNWKTLWEKQLNELHTEEQQYSQALAHCRACVGIGEDEAVDCGNTSCADYFPRKRGEYAVSGLRQRMTEYRSVVGELAPDSLEQLAW